MCENKTNPKQTDLYNVWNDFIHRKYFSIRVHKIFLFYLLFFEADATTVIQFLAEGSLTRLKSFSIFAISFSGPLAFSWNREKTLHISPAHRADGKTLKCLAEEFLDIKTVRQGGLNKNDAKERWVWYETLLHWNIGWKQMKYLTSTANHVWLVEKDCLRETEKWRG